ncbi:restriction endonuclease subunit S [Streptococcus infantis]|uniref:restriction endonuclease subunit S n=1 Tax=Streptococcus infantis TaxID=68892 RepID=UPI0039C41545
MKLIDVCNPKQWKTISASELVEDGYPVFGANGIIGYFSDYNHENPTLCITCRGATCGTVNKSLPYSYITGNSMALDDLDESVITIDFLYYFLQYRGFDDVITGSAQPQITRQSLSKITVPEIDLNIQKNITNIIKRLEQLILIREKQREKFNMLVKSRFNEMFGDPVLNEMGWDKCRLKDISEEKLAYGSGASAIEFSGLRYIRITDIDTCGNLKPEKKSPSQFDEKYLLNTGDILFARSGATVGKTFLYSKKKHGPALYAGYLIRLIPNHSLVNPIFVYHFTKTKYYNDFIAKVQNAVAQPNINAKQYSELDFILPPLSLQNEFADFVAQVDKSQFACQKAIKLWRNSLKSSII